MGSHCSRKHGWEKNNVSKYVGEDMEVCNYVHWVVETSVEILSWKQFKNRHVPSIVSSDLSERACLYMHFAGELFVVNEFGQRNGISGKGASCLKPVNIGYKLVPFNRYWSTVILTRPNIKSVVDKEKFRLTNGVHTKAEIWEAFESTQQTGVLSS